jgi:DNA-binding MarR family transcriptional regulator
MSQDPHVAAGRRPARTTALGDAHYRALGELRRAIRAFLAFSDEGARGHGLTSQQHQALLAIRAHAGPRPMSVGELADSLLIKSHSAVGLVTRLEERDLVARATSAEDRRRALLELRPHGAELLEAISVRNLRQLGEVAEILEDLTRTVRRLERRGGNGAMAPAPAADGPRPQAGT